MSVTANTSASIMTPDRCTQPLGVPEFDARARSAATAGVS